MYHAFPERFTSDDAAMVYAMIRALQGFKIEFYTELRFHGDEYVVMVVTRWIADRARLGRPVVVNARRPARKVIVGSEGVMGSRDMISQRTRQALPPG